MRSGAGGPAPAAGKDGDGDGEAGFVLLSVLVAVALFVAVAASLAVRSRILALQTANRAEAAAAQALADGAALFAADALRPSPAKALDERAVIAAAMGGMPPSAAPVAQPPALPIPVDGTPVSCALADGRVLDLAAVDQGGLVDLNGAPVPMLQAFFAASGLDAETARRLADEVADFRDPDDAPQENGVGERAQYAARGLAWGPRNAPFADAEEIAQLPSATPAIAARLRPLLTVANPRAGIDLAVIDRAASAALPKDAARRPGLARWQLASAHTDFGVEARLRRTDGSVTALRRALVSFAGRPSGAPRVLRWWRPLAAAAPAPGATAPRFCAALARALDPGGALRP